MWLRDLKYDLTDMDFRILKAINAIKNPNRPVDIAHCCPNKDGIKDALNIEKRKEEKQLVRRAFETATGKAVLESLKTLYNLRLLDRDPTKGTYWLTDEGDSVLAQGKQQIAAQMQDRQTARVKAPTLVESPSA